MIFYYNGNEYIFTYDPNDASGLGCIEEIVNRNEYNLNMFYNKKSVFIDIGANCGVATIILAKQNPESIVYSYEPCPETFKILEQNVNNNNLKNVKIFNMAITKPGEKNLKLFKHPMYSGGNTVCSDALLFKSHFNSEPITYNIECTSLDEVIKSNYIEDIELLKIDCEGSEFDIIYTSEKFKTGIIKNIVGEFHEMKYTTHTSKSDNLIEYCKQYVQTVNVSTLKIN